MAKGMEERVAETARAVEAGHAKDRSGTTYVVFMQDTTNSNWDIVGSVTVPARTHKRAVLRQAEEKIELLQSVTEAVLMLVPSEHAVRMPVKRPEPSALPLEIA